jgi:hypothetical protein
MKKVLVLVAVAAVVSVSVRCASLTPAGEKVALFRARANAQFLAEEDRIKTTCELMGEKQMGDRGGTDARNVARNYAATIGADTVLWWEYSEYIISRAAFYRCNQTPTPAAAPR